MEMEADTEMETTSRIFHAHVESAHWTFDAYGLSESQALTALRKGLLAHVKRSGAGRAWAMEMMDDVSVTAVELGSCWRDLDVRIA